MSLDPAREHRRRHMPTKLRVEDRFDLGHGVSITWRQGGIILVGLVVGFLVWRSLTAWLASLGVSDLGWVPIVPAALVILLFWAVALVKIQGRYPESWFAIWLDFHRFPKLYRWQPLAHARTSRQGTRGSAARRKGARSAAADDPEEDAAT